MQTFDSAMQSKIRCYANLKRGINMGVEIIFKIAGIGVLTAVVNQVLKYAGKDEIATLTTLAGVIVVLLMVVDLISNLFTTVKSLFTLFVL